MAKRTVNKREFFRVDTFLPIKISDVSQVMRDGLRCRMTDDAGLKPALLNISGGYISFKSLKEHLSGDLLEIIITLPVPVKTTVCLYGEVIKVSRTKLNHYRTVARFINMPEKIRELLLNFVFQWERTVLINTQEAGGAAFVSVPLDRLIKGTALPFEVFIKNEDGMKFLFDAGLPYDVLAQDFFEAREISQIFIRDKDEPLLKNYTARFRVKPKTFDLDDTASFRDYSFNKSIYHSIDRAVLLPHAEINFSLFAMNNYVFSPVTEASTEQPVTLDENVTGLSVDLFVRRSDLPLYRTYLNSLSAPFDETSMAEQLNIVVLKEHSKMIMHDLFTNPAGKDNVLEAVGISERIVECLRRHAGSAYGLLSFNCDDFYLYVHSVNVAVMSAAVGLAMKLEHENTVHLCIGALLHDIGHSAINDEIVNKQGRLNINEYEVFKTHVMEGIKILRGHNIVPPEALAAVFHHHEKMDGSGYPSGLSGGKISLFGRITALADAYDLLTPDRPYRKRLKPFEALSVIRKDAACYDPDILKVFIKILAKIK